MSLDPSEEELMTAVLHTPVDPRLFPPDKQDWTVDDLKSLPPDLRYELIDGRLILPAPTPFHQILGVRLTIALGENCPAGFSAAPDCSLEVNHRNEPRPDVVVVHDSVVLRTPAPIEQAILAVEIVSPSSHSRDTIAKVGVYSKAGVGSYLVVDPVSFGHGIVLTEFRASERGDYEIITSTSKIFETDVPYPIKIDLPALTRLRDKYLAAQKGS
jgi:Uma2 family endonuclease